LLELVALLALQAPHEQPAHRLADALYPDLDGDAALHALETALYRLRRLLPPGALRRGSIGVALDAAVVAVDREGPAARWLPEFEQPWAEAARRDD
jgi:DNA-binding SARP family transcriptional activator